MEKMIKFISTVQAHPNEMSPNQIEEWLEVLRMTKGVRVQELTANTVKRCKEGSLRCIVMIYFGDIAEMSVILDRLDDGSKYSVTSDVFFYNYQNNLKKEDSLHQREVLHQQNLFQEHQREFLRQQELFQQQQQRESAQRAVEQHQMHVQQHMQHVMLHNHIHHHNF
jgi:hypothetical protein